MIIIVNLEDSNYIITDQDFEENCNIEHQLNDELNSLQIYNHNLIKKINKFKRKSDQFNTPKSSSTIVSSSDSEDEDNRYMIKSNPESLNKCCHEKFGFEDLIKESTKIEELQWAEKTLPSYTIWDKFSQYHSLVELWINKVNITHMKKKEEDMVVENFEKKIIASKALNSEPIQITDEEFAKERIVQWIDQKNHSKTS
ncbi:unnamed protein product [Rhizophagus irregularis]|nr:unnamed protein product [Rhizophagus irregularis]